MTDHSDHDHTEDNPLVDEEISRRMCPSHDPGKHWINDYSYVFGEDEGTAGKISDMLEGLSSGVAHLGNDELPNPGVTSYMLVFTTADGLIHSLAMNGMPKHAVINMLARSISILAFQQDVQETYEHAQMHLLQEALMARLGRRHPYPPGDTPMPDSGDYSPNIRFIGEKEKNDEFKKDDDIPTGFYL